MIFSIEMAGEFDLCAKGLGSKETKKQHVIILKHILFISCG